MGFSVKLAPGVRVRASSRGVRTSIGPRAARVHVGSGRTGFSTGVGPVSYYTSSGGTRRSSGHRTGTAAANRQIAAANRAAAGENKADEARQLLSGLQAILTIHQQDFQLAQPPIAPAPPPFDGSPVHAAHAKAAKAATSVFSRAARKAALAAAAQAADAEVAAVIARDKAEHARWQAHLDGEWKLLLANDPDTVLTALAEAFEDNEAAAAAVGIAGAEVTLLVIVPPVSDIPERKPATTAAGNLTLKKLTKREIADFYKLLACGHVLVTVKEAFAVAPALSAARIIAVRAAAPDAYGKVRPEVLAAARFERSAMSGIRWSEADSVQIVNDASTELILEQRGATRELVPVDLTAEPALQALVDAVDFEELLG